MLNQLIGYRKVGVALLVFIASTVMFLTGALSEAGWVELNKFVIPAFLAANIAEYLMSGTKRGVKSD